MGTAMNVPRGGLFASFSGWAPGCSCVVGCPAWFAALTESAGTWPGASSWARQGLPKKM